MTLNNKILIFLISTILIANTSYAQPLVNETSRTIEDNQQNLNDTIDLEKITQGGNKTVILDKEDEANNVADDKEEDKKNEASNAEEDIPEDRNSETSDNNRTKTTSRDDKERESENKESNDSQETQEVKVTDVPFEKDKAPPSLMLTDEEIIRVEEAIEAFHIKKPLEEKIIETEVIEKEVEKEVVKIKEQSRIYLNAILYISKDNWIAWINGDKIVFEDNLEENPIYIKSISNNKANINWSMGLSKWRVLTGKQDIDEEIYNLNKETNQIELNFTLRTNQTYNLVSNKITEGKVK